LLSIAAAQLTPLKPASVSRRVGEMVFAFDHPWGQRSAGRRGIVSALVMAQNRRGDKSPVIRFDAPLAPGNSRGPLVNANGESIRFIGRVPERYVWIDSRRRQDTRSRRRS
jgi:serine protease Do